jgi:hypothetical protein
MPKDVFMWQNQEFVNGSFITVLTKADFLIPSPVIFFIAFY